MNIDYIKWLHLDHGAPVESRLRTLSDLDPFYPCEPKWRIIERDYRISPEWLAEHDELNIETPGRKNHIPVTVRDDDDPDVYGANDDERLVMVHDGNFFTIDVWGGQCRWDHCEFRLPHPPKPEPVDTEDMKKRAMLGVGG